MKDLVQNPKAESRNPKEGRRPKSEEDFAAVDQTLDPEFWGWGDAQAPSGLILGEESPESRGPVAPLAERTARSGEAIIRFAEKIPQKPANERLISQLVTAATSIGANYCEADDSVSGKEFKQKIGNCRKESKETMFFLRMIAGAEPSLAEEARTLWREAKDLNLILGAIWRK